MKRCCVDVARTSTLQCTGHQLQYIHFLPLTGLYRGAIWEAFLGVVYFPEEEQKQESDGVLLFMQLCQIPRWASELHRSSRAGHTRKDISITQALLDPGRTQHKLWILHSQKSTDRLLRVWSFQFYTHGTEYTYYYYFFLVWTLRSSCWLKKF